MNILGTGSSLPRLEVDNDRLSTFLDTSDEWISTRTGIRSRRVMTDETVLSMGAAASRSALENANLRAEQLDLILCATLMPDTVTPSLACILQSEIGAHCGAVDLNGACAGFVYALDMADAYIRAGKARRVLVVSSEAMTRACDWTDRATCVLFGDGAGAVVVGEGDGYLASRLTSDGDARVLNMYPCPGNSPFEIDPKPAQSLFMAGQDVYKFAVSTVPRDLKNVIEMAGLAPDDIDMYVLHQANKRILDAVRARLGQREDKFPSNIATRGNTSSASVAILLDELNRAGAIKQGDRLAISAFGAGLTTASCVVTWTKDQNLF